MLEFSFAASVSLCDILSLMVLMLMPPGHKVAAVPPGITSALQARRRMKGQKGLN